MAYMYGRTAIGQRGRSANGTAIQAPMTSDGAFSNVPWLMSLSLEGLIFSSQFGAANLEDTDPGTFGAGGVDLTEFDMLMTTPAAATLQVIPVYWKPVFEAIGTIAAVDVLLVHGSGAVIGANSVTNTLVNTNDASNNSSGCTIASLGDTGGTGITIKSYIYREGGTHLTGVAGTGQTIMPEWSATKTGVLHVLSGASRQVAGFASAQASTGFMHYMQAELPAGSI